MYDILYVDDEPMLLEIGKDFLEMSGLFRVETVTSPIQALSMLKNDHYEAVVSDYQMPDMDGIAFLHALRTAGNKIPFVIFTGRGREEVVIQALNEGADYYLQKGGEPRSQFAELSHKLRLAVERNIEQNELRTTQQALRETNDYLESLINYASSPIIVWGPDLVVSRFNQAFEVLTGYSSQEVMGNPIALLFPEDSRESSMRLMVEVVGGRVMKEEEVPIRHRSGKVLTVLWNSANVLANDGTPRASIAQGLDITEKKCMMAEIEHSHDLIDYIIGNSRSAIAVFDNEMRYLFVSEQYLKDYRVVRENVIGKSHYDIFPEVPERWKEQHRSALAGNVVSCDEDPFPRLDGRVDWVRWVCRPWYQMDGSIGGMVLDTTVLTAAKEEKELLMQSDLAFRTLFDFDSVGIVQVDPRNGKILGFNDRYSEILGYERSQLNKMSLLELTHPEDRGTDWHKFSTALSSGSKNYSNEKRLVRGDGSVIWASIKAVFIREADGTPVRTIGIIEDITDRKRMEEELRAIRAGPPAGSGR